MMNNLIKMSIINKWLVHLAPSVTIVNLFK